MICFGALEIPRGVTAVIGSGGKTTLLREAARELAASERTVILATTTHFLPFEDVRTLCGEDLGAVRAALATERVVCVAVPAEGEKLGPSPAALEALAGLADHVLVEADGSRGLPLKAHAAWEPVVPACSVAELLVVGASGFGQPVRVAVHRLQLFCERACCEPDDAATPRLVARVIEAEREAGLISPTAVIVNQYDEATDAPATLAVFDLPVFVGSLRSHSLCPQHL